MWFLLGCHPPEVAFDVEPTLTWSDQVESVAVLSWSAPPGSRSHVEWERADPPPDLLRPTGATPTATGAVVSLPLLGLAGGGSYAWRAVTVDADGAEHAATGQLTVPDAPDDLPRLHVDHSSPEAQVPTGFVLGATSDLATSPTSYAVVWNEAGEPVWWSRLPDGHLVVSTSLGATPGTVVFDDYDVTSAALTSSGHRARLDGSEHLVVPLETSHHTVIEPVPDQFVWPSRDVRPNPYQADTWVTADRVLRAPIGATDAPDEVLNVYDDVFHGAYTAPCNHPLAPLRYDGYFPVFEWSHLNSLVYLPDRDAYVVNLRWVDTVLLVDAPSGEVLWRLGGPLSDFTSETGGSLWTDADHALMSHPHFSEAWDGGLVAFDNHSHPDGSVSSIVEIAWDEDARTVREVFRWEDPQGRFMGVLGDVRKLPDGGYLAAWSNVGELNEVGPDGAERWRATTDPVSFTSRVQWIADLYTAAGP